MSNFWNVSPIISTVRALTIKTLSLCVLALGLSLQACSSLPDEDYIIKSGDDQGEAEQALSSCQSQIFLTQDCVKIVAEANEKKVEEQALVLLARDHLEQLDECYAYEKIDEPEIACDEVAQALLDGFDVCVSLLDTEKYFECTSIESKVQSTIDLCDLSSPDVTLDFCALINPTTDETPESSE